MIKPCAFVILILAPLAFAQLDSNSVTVTASRSANLQPDQALLGVYVDSDLHATLTDVLAPLQEFGITIVNFSDVNTVQKYDPTAGKPLALMLEWSFRLPVPITKTKDTIAALTALQQSLMQKNNGLNVSFGFQGTQVSQQLAQSQSCVISDLMADARVRAQGLASAAGLGVGNVLAMSSQTSASPGCFLTVKFALGRF